MDTFCIKVSIKMGTTSIDYGKKLLSIRKAEGFTQARFSEITGLAISSIKAYETGQRAARAEVMERVLQVPMFRKYTLWVMHGTTSDLAGQVAPSPSNDVDLTKEQSTGQKSTKRTG